MGLTIKSLLPQDEFPYVQDSSPIINSLGLIKLRFPTSPERQSLLGPVYLCYQGQLEYYLV